jgi:hypothetical protein
VVQFFEFYKNFNFGRHAVCVYLGNVHIVCRYRLLSYQLLQE